MPEVKWLGKVNVAPEGHYTGCVTRLIQSKKPAGLSDAVNEFFEQNQNLLLVGTLVIDDRTLLVTLAKTLTEEELDDMREFSAVARQLTDAKYAERQKRESETKVKEEEARAEERRLVALGRKCEQNHKKIDGRVVVIATNAPKLLPDGGS